MIQSCKRFALQVFMREKNYNVRSAQKSLSKLTQNFDLHIKLFCDRFGDISWRILDKTLNFVSAAVLRSRFENVDIDEVIFLRDLQSYL